MDIATNFVVQNVYEGMYQMQVIIYYIVVVIYRMY